MNKPRCLDLFCGAGGATKGLQQAGFYVVGVDIKPQPRYCGDEFHQTDAMTFPLDGYDFIWASPPCQQFSSLRHTMSCKGKSYPDLVDPIRRRLVACGSIWTIENVPGAPLARGAIMLCGNSFGLRVYRHRWFESSVMLLAPPHQPHVIPVNRKKQRRKEHFYRGGFVSVVGDAGREISSIAMKIDWMTGRELSEAIPPAYSRYIGEQMMPHVGAAASPAAGSEVRCDA